MKMKFFIHDKGDPSVGIFPYDATVTIEDNANSWAKEIIESVRNNLKSALDTEPLTTEVLTEDEQKRLEDEEKKWIEEMEQHG